MATLTNKAGSTFTVPDETVDDYLEQGWALAGAEPDDESDSKPETSNARSTKSKASDGA